MNDERSELGRKLRVGVFVLVALTAFLAMIYALGAKSRLFEAKYTIHAEFSEVGGLAEGATVRLADTDTSDEVTYSIVGDFEADIKQGRIAISAPLARAMIGREAGDTVTLKTGKGSREYQISEVRFDPQT